MRLDKVYPHADERDDFIALRQTIGDKVRSDLPFAISAEAEAVREAEQPLHLAAYRLAASSEATQTQWPRPTILPPAGGRFLRIRGNAISIY